VGCDSHTGCERQQLRESVEPSPLGEGDVDRVVLELLGLRRTVSLAPLAECAYATAVSYSPDGRWLLGQVPVYISDPRVIDYFNLIRFPVGPCLNGTLRAHQVIGRTEGAASWQALP
jgi:hypothetical protein